MAALLQLFGVAASLSLLLGIMGVPVLVGMLSPLPGGAGVREALMAAAARLGGVAAAPIVLAAIAYRLALFLVTPLVWGAVRLVRAGADRH
jgi:glycosyltransferase 2 family protein